MAVVLTKGTVSLAKQTLNRIRKDFKPFIDADAVQVLISNYVAGESHYLRIEPKAHSGCEKRR